MNSPSVRFDCFRYVLATRSTSAGVTFWISSRSRNSRRQSPSAADSLRLRPTSSESVSASSICFPMRALARSTSSAVGGCAARPSTVFKRMSRASSIDWSVRSSAEALMKPGSCISSKSIPHRDRFLAFHQRFVEPAAGRFAHQLRQHVQRGGIRMRAGGAVVDHQQFLAVADAAQDHGALAVLHRFLRVGLCRACARGGEWAPKSCAIKASVWASSNLPATVRMALSGW